MKAGGCQAVPPHTWKGKQIDKRCKDAPRGEVCSDTTETKGSVLIITDTGKRLVRSVADLRSAQEHLVRPVGDEMMAKKRSCWYPKTGEREIDFQQ